MEYAKSKETRDMIIRESYKLFVRDGYSAVTTRTIAEACGLQRANLHYYYNKKSSILLDILTTINSELKIYFYTSFPVWEMRMAFVIYYLYMSFGASEETCALQMLSWELFEDTDLMQEFIRSAPHFTRKGELCFNELTEKDTAVLVFYGTLSQLAHLRMKGWTNMSMREVIDRSVRAFFLYLGESSDNIDRMIEDLKEYDVSASVLKFIEHYEQKFGWDA